LTGLCIAVTIDIRFKNPAKNLRGFFNPNEEEVSFIGVILKIEAVQA
jgi:hypothetical protein